MAYVIAVGCGGCVQIFNPTAGASLPVIDSNNLPPEDIQIAWIEFDGEPFAIYEEFENLAALLTYLNTTFESTYNPQGFFETQGEGLAYTNPENYSTSEIVAIIKEKITVFKVGSPTGTVRDGLTVVDIANGFPLVSSRLEGIDPESVKIFRDTEYQTQLDEVFTLDTETGTLTFNNGDPEDQYIYVHHSQQLTIPE